MDLQQFYYIPGGQYTIGITDDIINSLTCSLPPEIKQEYLYHSYPAHTVSIASFYIAKRYVTVSEFAQFVQETGFVTQAQKDGWSWTWDSGWTKREHLTWQRPFGITMLDELYQNHSDTLCVLQISCNDAAAYCEYLSQKIAKKVCLPTEFMWEAFAQYAGIQSMDEFSELSPTKPVELHDYLKVLQKATTLNKIKPGFVWEWTDSYFQGYPGCRPHKEYGTTYKVLRGGSYFSSPLQRAREYRFRRCPTARSPFYTFRICIMD